MSCPVLVQRLPLRGLMTNRRQFMGGVGGGLVGLALPELFAQDRPRPHHPPRARAVIQLFMSGAASTCDMYDHKPSLEKHAGEPFDPGGRVELFQSSPGVVMPSPWKWRRHGESGLPMSSLVPRLAEVVDDPAPTPPLVRKFAQLQLSEVESRLALYEEMRSLRSQLARACLLYTSPSPRDRG